jgi:hypothetical protein
MDKTSKVIFALIAVGLWFNAAANLLRPAYAQQDALGDIKVSAQIIARNLENLVANTILCTNPRLCQR